MGATMLKGPGENTDVCLNMQRNLLKLLSTITQLYSTAGLSQSSADFMFIQAIRFC